MSRLNTAAKSQELTHGGVALSGKLKPIQELRRSVLSCLLWEDEHYESGQSIADRIRENALLVNPSDLAALAVEARKEFHLRHVPLLLLVSLCQTGPGLVADAVAVALSRPDEMGELLKIYWSTPGNGHSVPRQLRKGLQRSLKIFREQTLAKYDRDDSVKLRDVLRLARPKPDSEEQSALFKRVRDRELKTPDTWEVALSAGADKRETFERLLRENSLGYLALLRNLRNMYDAKVDPELVKRAIVARQNGAHMVFPFRYVAAARAASAYEPWIDEALCAVISENEPMPGRTIVLVDVSGSMNRQLSSKSDLTRMDAACALASIIPGDVKTYSFSSKVVEVRPYRGMAGIEALKSSQAHGSTNLGDAVRVANAQPHDRLIVVTDEQATQPVPDPTCEKAYMVNVASYENGVGYGKWTHLDGFSEGVLRFIKAVEADVA